MINEKTRLRLRLQSTLFLGLFLLMIGIIAWLTQLNPLTFDLSKNNRNSLSGETVRLIQSIETPLKLTLFASPAFANKEAVTRLFNRYQQQQPLIEFETVNPDMRPDLLNKHDIRFDGEALIEFEGRSEKVSQITEVNITNALQRLMRQGERWLVFLQGHGERNPYKQTNFDYSSFAGQLAAMGYTVENLNLTETNSIPANTDVLVVASPRLALLPGEVELLRNYLETGGSLLWLADPEQSSAGMEPVFAQITIDFVPGIIVDPNSQLLGLDRVDFALVTHYPRHPITENIDAISLFPQAQAIEFYGNEDDWQKKTILVSSDASWNETGEMKGDIFNGDQDDEFNGPFDLGISLSKAHEDGAGGSFTQRVAVIGDADFISNRYIGNGANLDIGINLVNWLSHDDNLISISPRPAPDTRLNLSQTEQLIISFGFLLILPALLFGSGLRIWLVRRKR
jgi:ABC-type uncharacterized transport system involved in gliding motility auxiliary subunit